MNVLTALHIRAIGHVQGVGFRAFVSSTARRLRLSGWVRNCSDGSVEAFAEGDEETLQSFVEILKEGNGYSSVNALTADPAKPRRYEGFSVEF
jgi:acylphosphatase